MYVRMGDVGDVTDYYTKFYGSTRAVLEETDFSKPEGRGVDGRYLLVPRQPNMKLGKSLMSELILTLLTGLMIRLVMASVVLSLVVSGGDVWQCH